MVVGDVNDKDAGCRQTKRCCELADIEEVDCR
jgi:hypothetical protein